MKTLTESEAKTLYVRLKESLDPRDTFLLLLFETGARVSETLTLGAQDLLGASLRIPPLKGSNPRTVTLSEALVRRLARLPPLEWSLALGAAATRPSRRRSLCRRFHAVTRSTLGRRVNLHALRHTTFLRLYVATKDLLLVKEWAGHRSIDSTLVYLAAARSATANQTHLGLLKSLSPGAD